MTVTPHHGDCLEVMRRLAAEGVRVDSIVTDPPYHLTSIVKRFGGKTAAPAKDRDGLYRRVSAGFMGQQWDGGDIAFRAETWALALALLKPGGHMFAFSGTRNYHRMAVAIEDAGFVIRDQFAWVYGSGFPKSHDIVKAIDKGNGIWRGRAGRARPDKSVAKGIEYERTEKGAPITDSACAWDGWGTAVKPAWEPICLAQKPFTGSIAANVLKHGVGGLNIDACRIEAPEGVNRMEYFETGCASGFGGGLKGGRSIGLDKLQGRFPANLAHDGSDAVLACFPDFSDEGSAARFFYSAKADAEDRWGSKHPTVKPIDLIRHYARLITPKGGVVLDPFAGSGTTGIAAMAEGFDAILIEREAAYFADIRARLAFYAGDGRHSLAAKQRNETAPRPAAAPLMDWLETKKA